MIKMEKRKKKLCDRERGIIAKKKKDNYTCEVIPDIFNNIVFFKIVTKIMLSFYVFRTCLLLTR